MQIFVTGVERSGATLAAAILHTLTIPIVNVGDKLRPPRPGWTHETLEDANLHRILTGSFETEGDLTAALSDYVRGRTESSGQTWAAKSCSFGERLPLLIAQCDQPVIIDVWRAPAAVMASWQAATDQPWQAAQAWYLARRATHERVLSSLACPVIRVGFTTLLDDPEVLVNALEKLGMEVRRAGNSFDAVQNGMVHYDDVGRWVPRAVNRKLGDWGKIAIGVRTATGPEPEFFMCYQRLLSELRPGDGVLHPVAHLPAHWAADSVARDFLRSDADTLFMLDDDMTFSQGDLDALRDHAEGQQYDMLSAFATRRAWPPRPITMRKLKYQPPEPMALQGIHYAHAIEYKEGYRVFDADMTGLAFTLIRRHVFEAMIAEWGPAWTSFFPYVAQQSDDAEFCIRAKGFGMRIGVCLDVPIGHIGREIFGKPQLARWLDEVASALEAVSGSGGKNAPAAA